MKTQTILQLIFMPLISMALYSCGGNEQTTAAALAAMNVPEMVGDSTVKTSSPVTQTETRGKKEKTEKDDKEESEDVYSKE
jgi:hypothetical protein